MQLGDVSDMSPWGSMYVNDKGDLFSSGSYKGNVDFNPGPFSTILSSNTGKSYLYKLGECESFFDSIQVNSCSNYISPSGKYTWYSDGKYLDTIITFSGCDSILAIDLTIHENSTNYLVKDVCGSLESPSGKYVWHTTGIYLDTIINFYGCDSIITYDIDIEIDNRISRDGAILSANEQNAKSYIWFDCASPDSILLLNDGKVFLAPEDGDYAVIIDKNDCKDTSDCINVIGVGIDDISISSRNILVYPNPTNGFLTFDLKNTLVNNDYIYIYNNMGQLLFIEELNEEQIILDLEFLNSGIYLLRYGTYTTKIILE
jgi:hypothetical protein